MLFAQEGLLMSVVLITGASHGIGKAVAEAFAANGHSLILNCAHSADELKLLAENLKETYHIPCMTVLCDVGNPDEVAAMFDQIDRTFHGIDIVINNAGCSYIGLFHEMSNEDWQRLLATNLSSVFYCCRQAVPLMLRNKRGHILNISSVWGEVGASCEAAYSATKGGVNAFTRALAKELAPSGISVNAISCGAIDTRMNACFSDEERAALEAEIPCGRYGTTKEVAELTLSLTNSTTYLTGQVIRLDGGWI